MIPREPYVFRAVDLLQRTHKALKGEPLLLTDIEAFFKDLNGEPTGIALLGFEVARQSERQGTACLVKVLTEGGGRLTWRYPGRKATPKKTAKKTATKKPSAKKAARRARVES